MPQYPNTCNNMQKWCHNAWKQSHDLETVLWYSTAMPQHQKIDAITRRKILFKAVTEGKISQNNAITPENDAIIPVNNVLMAVVDGEMGMTNGQTSENNVITSGTDAKNRYYEILKPYHHTKYQNGQNNSK